MVTTQNFPRDASNTHHPLTAFFYFIRYYSVYPLFAYCCVGAEIFYLLLYLSHADNFPDERISSFTWLICFPALVIKNIINVAQMFSAAFVIAEEDAYDKVQAARRANSRKMEGTDVVAENLGKSGTRTSARQRKQILRKEIPR